MSAVLGRATAHPDAIASDIPAAVRRKGRLAGGENPVGGSSTDAGGGASLGAGERSRVGTTDGASSQGGGAGGAGGGPFSGEAWAKTDARRTSDGSVTWPGLAKRVPRRNRRRT